MRKFLVVGLIVSIGWVAVALTGGAQDAKPKYTIKEVMKTAHKGGLTKKVAKGEASAEEKKQLVELYEALAANHPPMGDEASWKEKTAELVVAAKEAAEGKEGAAAKVNAIFMKCMGCHSAHKAK
jgi:hypothetical protein